MFLSTDMHWLDVAPLLPISTALAYVGFVVFGWEWVLLRQISGNKAHGKKDAKVLLPRDVADTKPQEGTSWISYFISNAIPMAHMSITSPKLWALEKTERASLNVCLVQMALVMAEFLIHYIKYHDWRRGRLMALGLAWCMMAMRCLSLVPDNKLMDITNSVCIAITSIFSILPEPAAATQCSSKSLEPDEEKSKEADTWTAEVARSRAVNVAYHMFSISMLLVYLLHEYPSLSSQTLYRFTWLGSMSHYLITLGLLLLQDGMVNWQATGHQGQTTMQHIRGFLSKLYRGTPEFVRDGVRGGVVALIFIVGPWYGLFFLTNYMTSCLGFRRLLLDRPRTSPQFKDGGIFGGFLYQMLVAGQLYVRWKRISHDGPHKTLNLFMVFVAAFGQAVTAVVVLATVFYVCRSLADWK